MGRILIVDDVMINRKLMKSVLGCLDEVEFVEAEDGAEAMAVVEGQEVDLIILDLMMPVMDGFQVLQEMVARFEQLRIPIIVNSAFTDPEAIQKALELGAYDFLPKPLTPQQMRVELPLKVRNALENYARQKKLQRINQELQEDLRYAMLLQETLLRNHQKLRLADMESFYQPSSNVGGDFFACREVDAKLWMMIADVSGHGVAAAMINSMIQAHFSSGVLTAASPAGFLEEMNRVFYNMTQGQHHLTAFVAVREGEKLTFANAGHPHPIHFDQQGRHVYLEQNGFAVAMFPASTYVDKTAVVEAGDVLAMFTDGLRDNLRNNQAGLDFWRHCLEGRQLSPTAAPEKIIAEAESFFSDQPGDGFQDDVALMLLKLR